MQHVKEWVRGHCGGVIEDAGAETLLGDAFVSTLAALTSSPDLVPRAVEAVTKEVWPPPIIPPVTVARRRHFDYAHLNMHRSC
jgi:hypothetical protein